MIHLVVHRLAVAPMAEQSVSAHQVEVLTARIGGNVELLGKFPHGQVMVLEQLDNPQPDGMTENAETVGDFFE